MNIHVCHGADTDSRSPAADGVYQPNRTAG